MSLLLINVYYGGNLQNTSTGVGYDIGAAFTFTVSDSTSFAIIRRQIYVGLKLLPSRVKLTIRVRMNTAQPGSYHFSLFRIENEETWDVIKQTATQVAGFKVIELVAEAHQGRNQSSYDPCPDSLPGGSNTPSVQTGFHPDSGSVPVPTYTPPVQAGDDPCEQSDQDRESDTGSSNDDDSAEAWDADMDEAEAEMNAQEILKDWHESIPFLNRGPKHPCSSFNDEMPMPYADRAFFANPPRLDEKFAEGQMFESKAKLISKLAKFHLKSNTELEVLNSSKTKYRVKCKSSKCKWKLYAIVVPTGAWTISTNPFIHTCLGSAERLDSHQMTARVIADVIKPALNDDLELSIKMVKHLVKVKFGTVVPSYNKLWRGKELAIADLFGSWEKSYEVLPSLLGAIKSSNPGTQYLIEHEPSTKWGVNIFNRVAWAFGPCIEAWPHLRPVISVDAGFLSGRYKGKLFMACAYDAEQQLLPLAFAICEKESIENWGWFMNWLRINVVGPGKICVISDQHLGIRGVFEAPNLGWCEENGEAVHRLCSQHICENIWKRYPQKWIKKVFKKYVEKKKIWRFEEGMDMIRQRDAAVHDYIMKFGKRLRNSDAEPLALHKWTQVHDGFLNRWGIMTSNGSEVLNSVFRIARQLPVSAIVEKTYYKCVDWFVNRREAAVGWEATGLDFSMNITLILHRRNEKARKHLVRSMYYGHNDYEVIDTNGIVETVSQ